MIGFGKGYFLLIKARPEPSSQSYHGEDGTQRSEKEPTITC